MWFLFQEILKFTVNNVITQSDYPLLQSMLKVYFLFKLQVQFDGDELSEVWIQCTCCNCFVHFHISDVKQGNFIMKKILRVFIKAAVFHHVDIIHEIST